MAIEGNLAGRAKRKGDFSQTNLKIEKNLEINTTPKGNLLFSMTKKSNN